MSVDDLRAQLRARGYLTHGIERWFALDPWSSRTFWVELVIVAIKAAVLIGAFRALPVTAVMLVRNFPLTPVEILGLFFSYSVAWVAGAFALIVATALLLKVRPSLPIDTPRALLAISIAVAGLPLVPLVLWWSEFDTPAPLHELLIGGALALVYFLVAVIVVSAALLSFSIYEVQRVPAIHQKSRTTPLVLAGLALVALLFIPGLAGREGVAAPPPMVVTTPTDRHTALIAVDGLTHDILRSRADFLRVLPHVQDLPSIPGESAAERWASLGTGVATEHHGVRAIEGVRFRGGSHVIQSISRMDSVLLRLAPLLGIARREPLPPTVRRRDYIWEIFAERGVPSLAVGWWTTADTRKGALHAIGSESIFGPAQGDALRVDRLASSRFLAAVQRERPRFATVYLPALDVILNRLELDRATQLASSLRALDGAVATVSSLRELGYEVVLVGLPGDGQRGAAVVASTMPLRLRSTWDVAPAVLGLHGFPASLEMPGTFVSQRIATYGRRDAATASPPLNEDYYENLKSLGYIR